MNAILGHRACTMLWLLAGMFAFHPARAAQSYDNCAGTISSLPATISTLGVWCLKGDLSTAITNGNAITIATNNVTIDCNDFKLGGLAAGDSSDATGIFASNRQNATIRRCNIRGFFYGIAITGGAGHLVEDNRLDNNLYMGIQLIADNSLVRRNRVFDTGGYPDYPASYGIYASADLVENIVTGVFSTATDSSSKGIVMSCEGCSARDNQVRALAATGTGNAIGLTANFSSSSVLEGNVVLASPAVNGWGIWGTNATGSVCRGNTVSGYSDLGTQCKDGGGNVGVNVVP
jgi:parallel beta-helix repeat protein